MNRITQEQLKLFLDNSTPLIKSRLLHLAFRRKNYLIKKQIEIKSYGITGNDVESYISSCSEAELDNLIENCFYNKIQEDAL
jgi:hypothetical protein